MTKTNKKQKAGDQKPAFSKKNDFKKKAAFQIFKESITTAFLLYMFVVFPVVLHDGYKDITITKYNFFKNGALIYGILMCLALILGFTDHMEEHTDAAKKTGRGRNFLASDIWMGAFVLSGALAWIMADDKMAAYTGSMGRRCGLEFLALVLVCGCGAALAAQAVSAPREEITFQEHIFSGDPAAADGLTVQLKTGMRYKLNWESTVQFSAQNYRAETSFRFLPAGQAEQQEIRYRGVEINFYRDAATSGDADVFGFSTAYQSLLDTLSPGESGSMTIRFADYYDEYPFEFSIDLPGVNYDPLVNWQDASADSEWIGERAQVALGCFFRIPVLPDEYIELGIDKNMDGSGSARSISSVREGDRFWMNTESVVTDDACFFWFGNRTEQDQLVDTSRIPGGYGVYMLPFGPLAPDAEASAFYGGNVNEVYTDQLTCFFPVDPEARIEHLGLTPDKTRLLLHAVENNTYYVTLIDCKTGDTLQQLAVSDFEPEDDYVNITETEDFVCIQQTQGRICVLTQDADGLYQIALRSDYLPDDLYAPVYATVRAMAFDGRRLVIVNNDETVLSNDGPSAAAYLAGSTEALITPDGTYVDNCGFVLTVFDETGLAYSGGYVSSLEGCNYVNGRAMRYEDLIQPDTITLSWQADTP